MKIKATAFVAIASFLAACNPSASDVTDSQLEKLLGGPSTAYDMQLINKDAVECLRLLSGLADDVFQDAPDEVVARYKTTCRKELDKRIRDENRNPMGLEMAAFEDKKMAQRVEAIRDSQQETIKTKNAEKEKARLEEQNRQEQQLVKENTEKLAQAKLDASEHVIYVDNWLKEMEPLCAELNVLKAETRANRLSTPLVLTTKLLRSCQEMTFVGIRKDAETQNEKIQQLTYDPTQNTRLRIPDFYASDEAKLNKIRSETETVISDLESFLADKLQKS